MHYDPLIQYMYAGSSTSSLMYVKYRSVYPLPKCGGKGDVLDRYERFKVILSDSKNGRHMHNGVGISAPSYIDLCIIGSCLTLPALCL